MIIILDLKDPSMKDLSMTMTPSWLQSLLLGLFFKRLLENRLPEDIAKCP